MGAFAADPAPSTTTNTPTTCSPNLGGSEADPDYDNPSFSIFNSVNYSQSPSLTLALLLEAWPVNSYPYVVQLPSGSVLVGAGGFSTTCQSAMLPAGLVTWAGILCLSTCQCARLYALLSTHLPVCLIMCPSKYAHSSILLTGVA